ncbi:MAG: transglycosylase domain-containing protein, partial [Myxococcota bacterium]
MSRPGRSRRARWLLACAIAAVGAAWLAVVGVGWGRCRLVAPAPTIQVRDRHGAFLGEIGVGADERLGFWPIDRLPDRMVAATLALEDRRFDDHPGVDPIAIARAIRQNWTAGERVSGASTLAMQVARLQDPGPRTVPRKVVEAVTALLLVDRFGRDAVLRQYLTLAPYGNNLYGAGYAARRYFDKPVDDLSWAETAFLAAIPQAPSQRDPYDRYGRARAVTRAVAILDQLLSDGVIDEVAHAGAVLELGALRPIERPVRPAPALHPVLAFDREPPGPGPIVVSSLDLILQGRIQAMLRDAVAGWEDQGAGNAAAVVVDLATMQVLADVGSTGWYDERHAGAIDFSRTERYPGSTLKPFLYAHAFDRGLLGPGTVLDDLARGPDGIGNADGLVLGPMLPRVALANSRNVPAITVTRALGLDDTWSVLARLGLHDDALPVEHYGLGLAIGGMPTTPLELARAWG